MSVGKISSLGLGSGFELQSMLEQLREIDEEPITTMKTEVEDLETQISELGNVQSKIYSMKSQALALSLESNYIDRSVSFSDSTVLEGSVLAGATESNHTITVNRLATADVWQTSGMSSDSDIFYIPTYLQTTTGVSGTDASIITSGTGVMTILHGTSGANSIGVALTSGMTLSSLINAINTDSENDDGEGGTYVTASSVLSASGYYYLKVASTTAGNEESNRVTISTSSGNISLAAPDLTLSYRLGNSGTVVSIDVAADTTYAELVSSINNDTANTGLTASVIDDGSAEYNYKFILTSNNTGEDNRITLLSGLTMYEVNASGSLNASLDVDGITYQRQSNNIDDIIQSTTFTILKSGGSSTMNISQNTSGLTTYITELVTTFNDLLETIDTDTSYDLETETWGTLSSSVSLKAVPNDLSSLISTLIETEYGILKSGETISIYDLGFEFNDDGTVAIDSDTLSTKLSSNIEDVMRLFLGDEDAEITGIADLLNDYLTNLIEANGMIESEIEAADYKIEQLEEDIENDTERLDAKYELMTERFIELDTYISQMQTQADFLQSIFSSSSSSSKEE